MTTTEKKVIERKDLNAARVIRGLAKTAPSVCAGIVSAETLTKINEHARMLGREIVAPLFGVECPPVVVSIDVASKRQLGHFKPYRDGLGLAWRISINARFIDREWSDVIRTLLHEILHAVQHKAGAPGKGNSQKAHHNVQFREWSERAGIPCDQKGVSLGITPDGPYAAYVARHKLEGKIGLVASKTTIKAAPTKNKKWSCGCTNIRCAVELHATCNECGEEFVLQSK